MQELKEDLEKRIDALVHSLISKGEILEVILNQEKRFEPVEADIFMGYNENITSIIALTNFYNSHFKNEMYQILNRGMVESIEVNRRILASYLSS